jgi:hypothetical protein
LGAVRERRTTGVPAAARCVARETPRNPLPPAMTTVPEPLLPSMVKWYLG